ncbi:MAG: UPF0262 family protein [Alphaproteobacteria bacterium]|nr:MAG: UPF0262 family protein [Alphaproteobacteria bacterium]
MNAAAAPAPQRIAEITLDERTVIRRSRAIEDERTAAITDLLKDNRFTPLSGLTGPYHLHLAVEENRLIMEIRPLNNLGADGSNESIVLPLAPFRRIVKDYFLVCESYYEAIRDKSLTQVEAIDVGRRSLHDEGSELLAERLAGRVAIDHDTARRLFTLICVLHLRS